MKNEKLEKILKFSDKLSDWFEKNKRELKILMLEFNGEEIFLLAAEEKIKDSFEKEFKIPLEQKTILEIQSPISFHFPFKIKSGWFAKKKI